MIWVLGFDLVNLKVGAIEWKASPHCCSTWYLFMICSNIG